MPLASLGSQTMKRLMVRSTFSYIHQLQGHYLQGQPLPELLRQIYRHSGRLCLQELWYSSAILALGLIWKLVHFFFQRRGAFATSGSPSAWWDMQHTSCFIGSGGICLTFLTFCFTKSLMTFRPLQGRPTAFKTDKNFPFLRFSGEIICLWSA